jgi:hypothetical protein
VHNHSRARDAALSQLSGLILRYHQATFPGALNKLMDAAVERPRSRNCPSPALGTSSLG